MISLSTSSFSPTSLLFFFCFLDPMNKKSTQCQYYHQHEDSLLCLCLTCETKIIKETLAV
uniref:Uncharacterized protein n=1 Tax=Tetranychus urticae TaxID=32264 RepID=T1KNC0_TETUR